MYKKNGMAVDGENNVNDNFVCVLCMMMMMYDINVYNV